jgi:arylsulfatase A-like enzyme
LAVPEEWRDKYKGRYDKGYDAIRVERLDRQKKLGIVGKDVVTFPRLPNIPAWEKLTDEQRRQAARKMELYAAMIEYMDAQIGRLIGHLKKSGKYDNTLIVFISDNGAAGEDMAELVNKLAPTAKDWFDKTFDNRRKTGATQVLALNTAQRGHRSAACRFACSKGSWPKGAFARHSS